MSQIKVRTLNQKSAVYPENGSLVNIVRTFGKCLFSGISELGNLDSISKHSQLLFLASYENQ